jgi:hypothetical protein
MKCDVCASDNLEGAAYCEDCGAKLVVSHNPASVPAPSAPPQPPPQAQPAPGGGLTCPSCGAHNLEGELYCVDCGANLGHGDGAATQPPPVHNVPVTPTVAPARMTLVTTGRDFRLDKEIITIGRRSPADNIEPDIDLTNDDPDSYVSRRHAQILRNDDHFVYEDVGSSNGSFVNNSRLQAGVQQILKDGDKIRVGKTEFVFHAS